MFNKNLVHLNSKVFRLHIHIHNSRWTKRDQCVGSCPANSGCDSGFCVCDHQNGWIQVSFSNLYARKLLWIIIPSSQDPLIFPTTLSDLSLLRSMDVVPGTPPQCSLEMTTSTGSQHHLRDLRNAFAKRETAAAGRFVIINVTTQNVQKSSTPMCSITPRSTAGKNAFRIMKCFDAL